MFSISDFMSFWTKNAEFSRKIIEWVFGLKSWLIHWKRDFSLKIVSDQPRLICQMENFATHHFVTMVHYNPYLWIFQLVSSVKVTRMVQQRSRSILYSGACWLSGAQTSLFSVSLLLPWRSCSASHSVMCPMLLFIISSFPSLLLITWPVSVWNARTILIVEILGNEKSDKRMRSACGMEKLMGINSNRTRETVTKV